ncbi:MAG: hypothetical protein Q9162_007773 [Coniocarpon cinnabarinum]
MPHSATRSVYSSLTGLSAAEALIETLVQRLRAHQSSVEEAIHIPGGWQGWLHLEFAIAVGHSRIHRPGYAFAESAVTTDCKVSRPDGKRVTVDLKCESAQEWPGQSRLANAMEYDMVKVENGPFMYDVHQTVGIGVACRDETIETLDAMVGKGLKRYPQKGRLFEDGTGPVLFYWTLEVNQPLGKPVISPNAPAMLIERAKSEPEKYKMSTT